MISEDSKAIILLCTRMVLDKNSEVQPFTLSEWNALAKKIASSNYQRPGSLFGETMEGLVEGLQISTDQAARTVHLLGFARRLGFEFERLESTGIWIITRADKDYPQKYKERLKEKSPAVLFGVGEKTLLNQAGVAIVGSRNITENEQSFAEMIGNSAAYNGMVVFSGGARGVDITAMKNAIEGRGCSVGLLADSLERAIRKPEYRRALLNGDMALISPYGTNTGFSVGAAMGRNKLIYGLADYAVVVSSDHKKGGTWAGAIEAMKYKWLPVFVRQHEQMPLGNQALIQMGGIELPDPLPVAVKDLKKWMDEQKEVWQESSILSTNFKQGSLF